MKLCLKYSRLFFPDTVYIHGNVVCWQHLDFWSEPSSFTDTVFLRVSPQQSDLVDKLLSDAGIRHDVVVSDLQRSVGVVSI